MTGLDDLIGAIQAGDVSRVTSLLRDDPGLATARPSTGPSALLMAAYMRNPEMIALVRALARCDAAEAAALGDAAALRAILAAHPADISFRSGDGWTPLHLAAFFGQVSTVAYLLQQGADVRAFSTNREANTPLHAALAGGGSPAVVQALLEAGADPSAVGGGGYRPLHIAASRGDRRTVDALLARGADPRALTADGRTASAIAAERNFPEVADLLTQQERGPRARAGE